MKVPMSRITIYGSKKDRKAILEFLQRKKIIDIREPEDEDAVPGFERLSTAEQQSEFQRSCAMGGRALEILDQYAPQYKKLTESLNGRTSLTAEEYYKKVDDIPEISRTAKRITELSEEIEERKGLILRYKGEKEELEPWMGLDIPIGAAVTKTCVSLGGVFSEELTAEKTAEKYYSDKSAPPAYFEVLSSMPQQTCVLVICAAENEKRCAEILRRMGFSPPKADIKKIPAAAMEELEKKILALEKEISLLTEELVTYGNDRSRIRFMADYYSMRAEKYRILAKLRRSRHTFMLEGYVPASKAEGLAAELEHKYNAAAEIEPAGADAPVLLKNNRLARPAEGVVRTFAMPSPGEIDPTAVMSLFYYIFFGLMLSDAGYGILMTLGCFIALKRYKNMEDNLKGTLRMFMYCGISTIFWGVMFGSWFGDAVEVISGTFFGHTIVIPPLWFEPVNDPIRMLMFCFLFGLIHLFTALGINLYQKIKARDYMGALTDCVFWYMLVGGGVVYLFSVDMFLSMAGIHAKLPRIWANVAAVIALIGAVGILLFTARSGGIGKRLAKGAYALYGITGWLGDILSYSRLLALGLATGVIATVFNSMGSMFGSGIVGVVIFVLVFIVGHTMNIGINLLGAYVHTNRLQFVEFFGKFYEGGGREFEPFESRTKYYKFKEE